jgi:DNA polymerase III delta subunit
MLNTHVARLRECQLLAEQGVRPKEAAGRLRRSPYYVQKLFAQAEAFSAAELQQVSTRLAALDFALKGGSRLPGDLELDRALVDITAAPGPKEGD